MLNTRTIIFFLVLIVLFLVLTLCQPRVEIKRAPEQYNIYFPLVARDFPRHPLRGVAASGNGGAEAVVQTEAVFFLNWWHEPAWVTGTDAEFVPMVRLSLPQTVVDSEYLLTSNEPNVAAQDNICPADYVDIWHEIETRWGDRQLISPGVGFGGNTTCRAPNGETHYYISGVDWLTDFREFYRRQYGVYPKWDALSWHCYPPPESTCGDFREATEAFVALADVWGIDEVWVSEWDAGKFGSQNPQRILDAMKYWQTVPKVTRVAYWQDYLYAAPENSPLVDANGQITEYGIVYRQ